MAAVDIEQQRYEADTQTVKDWWKGSRWRYTKRPYTAEEIVAKRGNLKWEYPSNTQSQKLWRILEERYKVGSETRKAWCGNADELIRTKMPVLPLDAWNLLL